MRKSRIVSLLLWLVLLLLNGCLYYNVALLDTAEPLQLGRPEVQIFKAHSLDLETLKPDSEKGIDGGDVTGEKIAIGLDKDFEIGLVNWDGEGRGLKFQLKKRFYHKHNLSISVIPAKTFLERKDESTTRTSNGYEFPLLVTYRYNENFAGTVQAHFNYQSYSEISDIDTKNHILRHGGIIGGVNAKYKILSVFAEGGLEVAQDGHNHFDCIPTYAGSIGLEF